MATRIFTPPPEVSLAGNCVRWINADDEPYLSVRLMSRAMFDDLVMRYPDFVGHPNYVYVDEERREIHCWPMAAELLKKEPAPDLSRAVKQPAVPDFSKMTDDEYNHWYVTEGSGKDLGLVR